MKQTSTARHQETEEVWLFRLDTEDVVGPAQDQIPVDLQVSEQSDVLYKHEHNTRTEGSDKENTRFMDKLRINHVWKKSIAALLWCISKMIRW